LKLYLLVVMILIIKGLNEEPPACEGRNYSPNRIPLKSIKKRKNHLLFHL
jgi:hypothetical protein